MIYYIIILILLILLIINGYYKKADTLEFNHMKNFNKKEFILAKNTLFPLLFKINNDFDIKFIDHYLNHNITLLYDNNEYIIKLKDYFNSDKYENKPLLMNNGGFLDNTLLNLKFNKVIGYLEDNSYLMSKKNIYFLNKYLYTSLMHDVDDHIYLHVINGKIHLKLFLPNDSNYIKRNYNETLNIYTSEYNPWRETMIECLDIYLYENNIIKIPRFWWYTFKGLDNKVTVGIYKTNSLISYIIANININEHVRQLITT